MKPRTKFEKRIVELKDSLPPISMKIKKWYYNNFIKPVGFTTNGDTCYCGNCGKSFKIKHVIGADMREMKNRKKDPCIFCPNDECREYFRSKLWNVTFSQNACNTFIATNDIVFDTDCPHCRKSLEVHFSQKRKIYKSHTGSVLKNYKGIQLWRNFKLDFEFTKGETWNCKSKDLCVIWINERGNFRSVRNKMPGYNEHDSKGKVIPSLTNDDLSRVTRWEINKYCTNLYPILDLAPFLKIRGLDLLTSNQLESYNQLETDIFNEKANPILFIKALLKYPFVETLIKQGDFKTLHTFFSYSKKEFETVIPSYLIIKRHNYIPSDLRLWIDMALLYYKAGKDIRNPKYICPNDLQKGHEEAQTLFNNFREKKEKKMKEDWERVRPRDIWWFLDHHPDEERKCVGNDEYLYQLAEQFGGLNPGWHLYFEDYSDEQTGDVITVIRRYNNQGLYDSPFGYLQFDPQLKEERDKQFEKTKGKYRNIEFSNDEFTIKTLNTWDEYYEEGKLMHNCVETNGYWNKPGTLILSVRNNDEIIADVEISLRTFKILQCWGPCNQHTPYKEKIEALIQENVQLIKDRVESDSK